MNCTRATSILSLALALTAVGCGGNGTTGDAGDAGHVTPAGPDAAAPRDASLPAAPDAAVEAGPDADTSGPPDAAAPPARSLVPMHLLGDSPLDNRMLDPDLNNLGMWYFYMEADYSTPTYYRPVLAASPANLPVLRVEQAGSTQGVIAASFAIGGKGPFTASVWLGQPAKTSTPATLSAQVQALDANTTDTGSTSFDLTADDTTTQTIGTVRWTQFTAQINTEILGWAVLAAIDTSGTTLYVTAPVLVEDTTRMRVEPRPGRPLTVKEQETLRHLMADARKRMPMSERLLHKPKPWPRHRAHH